MQEKYIWNPAACSCENGSYTDSIIDGSVIMRDETTNDTDCVATNVMNTVPTNFYYKKVRCTMDCYILHTVLLVIILLLIIAIICYYYAKHRSKQKIVLRY